jgi:hypothetical protein
MSQKFFVAFLILSLAIGFTAMASAYEKKPVPVISQSFASKEIRPDDTWKVYIDASDPDGNMRYIFAIVEQPGVAPYPLSITRIKKENSKEFSGYLYLNSAGVGNSKNNKNITLTIQIRDQSGQFSEPAAFPLSFHNRYSQAKPSERIFKENNLGPIMITLKPTDGPNAP